MFYNKFCNSVNCSVIKVITIETSCTGSIVNSFRYLNKSISCLRSLLCDKAEEIKVLDFLVVTVVSDFRNNLCCSSLYLFNFINVPP